jgi:hypothetical protein
LDERIVLHLQGKRVSQARNQHEAGSKAEQHYDGLLLGLFFEPEDRGDMFPHNVT